MHLYQKKGLGSGLFDLKTISKNKIRWALGSDIGAGPYLSMVDVMNSFVSQHKKTGLANYTRAFFRPLWPERNNAKIISQWVV